jgi:NAD(P)H-dependent flavin oxidoreductase YrpB (nitropropane dioxygenase family)
MAGRFPSPPERSLTTPFCTLVGVQHPVVQGGMGPPHSSPELVAAVSNAGGLGVLGCSGFTAEEIAANAARIRELTQEPFGLNLLLFASTDDAVTAVLAERPRVVSFAWPQMDQPLQDIVARAHEGGSLVMPMVSSRAEARRAAAAGADVVVAQGTEGGGHVGVMGTMALTPQVVDAVAPLPVLAAGGIADGRGLAAALMLGAAGVLLGTRFLATAEAPISDAVKRVILNSDGSDTDLTEIPDIIAGRVWPGAFARSWRNALIREWSGREWELRQRRPAVAAANATARATDDVEHMPILFGQDAGLIAAIEPASVVVERIVREAVALLGQGAGLLTAAGEPGSAER